MNDGETDKDKETLPPDDLRCNRNDGRTWRCKNIAVVGKSHCSTHLYRFSTQKKPNKIKENCISTQETVARENEAVVTVARDVGVVAEDGGFGRKDGRMWRCERQVGPALASTSAMRVPRVKRPAVIADVEGRENGGVDFSERRHLRVKRANVVADVEGREGGDEVAMPAVIGDVEGGENDGVDLSERRYLRVKRVNVSGDVEGRENGGDVAMPAVIGDVDGGGNGGVYLQERRYLRDVRASVIDDVEGREKGDDVAMKKLFPVEEGLRDELRCTRNDGREWRCKRRVLEGQTLCEPHFKGIKLIKPIDRQKSKKKRKKSKEGVIGSELAVGSENEVARSRLAMVADLAVREGEEEWRCTRNDGRGWRCKRRVSDGKTMCEIHYEQGRLRQKRISVPESLKLQRGEGGERIEKKLKRKRALEILESNSDKGMKRMKAELIRVFLRREIIEQSKKSDKGFVSDCHFGEITRDLPYGFMAIPPATPAQILENALSLGIKVGVNCSNSLVKRRFRSKNIEPLPVGPLKVVPFAGNVGNVKNGGRRKCHWCQNSDLSSLTKCLSCRKLFFCAKCIKERDTDPEEVEDKCPVCRESCDCKGCSTTQTKDVSTKEILKSTFKGSRFHQLQYLIKLLLPILGQINQEQSVETETEARFKGPDHFEVEIRQADIGCKDQCCCNNCKSPILDFHRSCPNCSYNLCLSCCRECTQGECHRGTENPHNVMKTHLPGLRICSENILRSSSASISNSTPPLHISCPPMELGGCDNSLLEPRYIFPLNWTKELEISAKETVSEYELPQTTDDSLHCSSCASVTQGDDNNKEVQEASGRTQSHDKFVYSPSSSDHHYNLLSHFQKHWRKGHPVKIRNVLQSASALRLDPLSMFCSCLEKNPNNCVNRKHGSEIVNCTDWYEVEIGTRESFTQFLEKRCTNRRNKNLKVKAKFSSCFSRKLLEDHCSDIIHALPLQEYTNPRSGLLNIAGKLPEDFPESKLGPHVCISFGSREVVARGELVTKLHYNSYDVVNILIHVTNSTCSTDQLNKISMLIRQKSQNNRKDQSSHNLENNKTGMHIEISEGIPLENGVIDASCCSPVTNGTLVVNLQDNKSPPKLQSSDIDSDASLICSDTSDGPCKSIDEMSRLERLESSGLSEKRPSLESCGAYWDVFRRQDIPKLLGYIRKHAEELSFSCDFPKNVVHPIFDGSFYLDSTHKMQLKEEFDIEPWTFNQCLGEAVFIPAGCPYQIRNVKSCVNIALGFISPENASECIKLINEIRSLPNNHKAKEMKLEVEKMTICSIDEAIKEIYRLRSEESNLVDKGVQIPI